MTDFEKYVHGYARWKGFRVRHISKTDTFAVLDMSFSKNGQKVAEFDSLQDVLDFLRDQEEI